MNTEELVETSGRRLVSVEVEGDAAVVRGSCSQPTGDNFQERVRLRELGRAAALLAHELRQPLGSILNLICFIRSSVRPADKAIAESMRLVEQQAELASAILASLTTFAKSGEPVRSQIQLHRIVYDVLDRTAWPPQVLLRHELADVLPLVAADPRHVDRMISNLINNALESIKGTGTVTISTRSDGDHVVLQISDTGCGVEPSLAGCIFEPFVTTKPNGTGLGLALSCELAQVNGGSISFTSCRGKGSTFELRLPRAFPQP